jgi:RNA polymerase sigma-70 factor (ECF subfamily)
MTTKQYNQCVDQFSDGLFAYLCKQFGDAEAARDAVQDAFEVLWKKRKEVAFEKAKSYLYTTAYRDAIDAWRKKSRLQFTDHLAETAGVTENSYLGIKELLDQGLSRLPEIQRSVILLRDYEGYSYKEIGEITQLSESQVKVYIFRARRSLRTFLGKLENAI